MVTPGFGDVLSINVTEHGALALADVAQHRNAQSAIMSVFVGIRIGSLAKQKVSTLRVVFKF